MRHFAVLLLAISFAACNSASPVPASPTVTAAPPGTRLPGGVLVVFNREGGFAYSNQTLTVRTDGTATFEVLSGPDQTKVEGKIRPERFEALTRLLNDPAFAALPSGPYVQGTCSDCVVYTIRALTPRGVKTIQVTDADLSLSDPPPLLRQTIDMLTGLLAPAE